MGSSSQSSLLVFLACMEGRARSLHWLKKAMRRRSSPTSISPVVHCLRFWCFSSVGLWHMSIWMHKEKWSSTGFFPCLLWRLSSLGARSALLTSASVKLGLITAIPSMRSRSEPSSALYDPGSGSFSVLSYSSLSFSLPLPPRKQRRSQRRRGLLPSVPHCSSHPLLLGYRVFVEARGLAPNSSDGRRYWSPRARLGSYQCVPC